jgi:hypothetical protein
MNHPHPGGSAANNAANSADVTRVLNDCAALISQAATTLEEEIQATELVVILADLQAGRAESSAACVRRIFPQALDTAIYHGMAEPTLQCLQTQAHNAGRTASFYRARLKQLRRQYAEQYANVRDKPTVKSWQLPPDALHAFDHFAYPLGTLMQTLPGDITNVGSLNQEERQMCESVGALAYQAHDIVMDGLDALGALLAQVGDMANARTAATAEAKMETVMEAATLTQAGNLLTWLTGQARFMAQNAAEYGAAAMNLRGSCV